MTTTTKEYIYKSAENFLGPDRSVENEMEVRMSIRKRAEMEIRRLKKEREYALQKVQETFQREVWSSVSHWANAIDQLDASIRDQEWYFKQNSKRYIELLDRKDELKEMLAKELA